MEAEGVGVLSLEKRRLQAEVRVAFQYLKEPARQMGRELLQEPVVMGQGAVASNSPLRASKSCPQELRYK